MLHSALMLALLYVRAGLSIIPIKPDGSKSPAIKEWRSFQHRRPTEQEIYRWFDNDKGYGIAVLGGDVSGRLEIIDFDYHAASVFPLWCEIVESLCEGLLLRVVIIKTPRGFHIYYRCGTIQGNQKLAQKLIEVPEGTDGARLIDGKWMKRETLVETRGAGGYALTVGCPPECHPNWLTYEARSGALTDIGTITAQERAVMHDAARTFNEYIKARSDNWTRATAKPTEGNRSGDDYNSKGDWFELLSRHGWKYVHSWKGVTYWKRPGKNEPGLSATTNYAGSNLLYVFSTNADPFDDRRGYSLFSAYTLLEHGNDFKAAAKALAAQGYGEQRKVVIPPVLKPISKPSETITLNAVERPKETIKLSMPSRPTGTMILNTEVAR
jgi:hypothetical protein